MHTPFAKLQIVPIVPPELSPNAIACKSFTPAPFHTFVQLFMLDQNYRRRTSTGDDETFRIEIVKLKLTGQHAFSHFVKQSKFIAL